MPFHLPRIRLRYWLPALAILILVAGVAAYLYPSARGNQPTAGLATAAAAFGDVAQTVSANGTLNPVTEVNVGSQVSGTVQKLLVDYNSRVHQGQVLLQLDPTLFKAQVAQSLASLHSAQANLTLTRINVQRMQALHKTDYVSQADLDQAQASYQAAQAQVEMAAAQLQRDRTNLAYSVIRSPVDGVVVDRQIDVGQTVAASFQTPTLFKIGQNLRDMQIDVTVDEADVGQIEPGQTVNFGVDAYPERRFVGKVRQVRLNATIQQNVVTYDVVVGVDNGDGKLLPGMTAYVNIVILARQHVLLVPNAALRVRIPGIEAPPAAAAAGDVVYVLQDGRLRRVPVKIGASDGKQTEIVSGELRAGDHVVTGFAAAPRAKRGPFQLF